MDKISFNPGPLTTQEAFGPYEQAQLKIGLGRFSLGGKLTAAPMEIQPQEDDFYDNIAIGDMSLDK